LEYIKPINKDKELKKLYQFIVTNGKGGSGKVVTAKAKVPNDKGKIVKELVAVKRIPINSNEDVCISEVACLVALVNPNIVQFKVAYRLPQELWIVMEFMEGGTLSHAVQVHSFCEEHIAYVLQQVTNGLEFIHSNGFAHRDIKYNNIMININGNIKIIDFGLCADVSKTSKHQLVGTIHWMAPEVILRIPHNTKCDIWSLGILAIEMYLKTVPFSSSRILSMFKTVCGETIEYLDTSKVVICEGAHDFIKDCLIYDPEKRASAADLQKNPFIANASIDKSFLSCLKTIFISLTMHRSGF